MTFNPTNFSNRVSSYRGVATLISSNRQQTSSQQRFWNKTPLVQTFERTVVAGRNLASIIVNGIRQSRVAAFVRPALKKIKTFFDLEKPYLNP